MDMTQGADGIPVEGWECMGNVGTHLLCRRLNSALKTENMPLEWRRIILVQCLKGKEICRNAKITH